MYQKTPLSEKNQGTVNPAWARVIGPPPVLAGRGHP